MKASKSYKTLFTGYHLIHNEIYLSLSEILEELSVELSSKYIFNCNLMSSKDSCDLLRNVSHGVQGLDDFGVGAWVNSQIDSETHCLVRVAHLSKF